MKPVIVKWDVLAHMNNAPQELIESDSIAVIYSEDNCDRIEIRLNIDGSINMRKVSRSGLDTITITANHQNSINIK